MLLNYLAHKHAGAVGIFFGLFPDLHAGASHPFTADHPQQVPVPVTFPHRLDTSKAVTPPSRNIERGLPEPISGEDMRY